MAPITQAQLFATEYAKDTAREMLDTIKQSAVKAKRVTTIALAVSMPHQIGFILGLAPLVWSSIPQALESVTLILGALLIPVAVDYLILICIQALAARGMADGVKWLAFVAMLFPIGVSGTVNFMAPAPLLIKVLFVVAVVLIPLAEGLRAIMRPDFRKIEAMETEVAGQVSKPRTLHPDEAARRAEKAAATREKNRLAAMTPSQRRAYRASRAAAEISSAVDAAMEAAPVSPAPAV